MTVLLLDRNARLAAIVFSVAAVVAFFVFLAIGHDVWFWYDDWGFLAARSLNLHDVFASHNGHLVALPVVVYRTLFSLFGLRTHLPYLVLIVAAHVAAAVLLRIVMRRAGVGPWIATAAAGLYLFFGAGGHDILWGFQITFVFALVFGLGQLLLADHDGPVDRRDWFALAAGALALLCSGVALTMIVVVGMAVLARRGWRAAALQTAPLAVAYATWFLAGGRDELPPSSRQGLLQWDQRGISSTFDALGQVPFMGWVLGALLVVGLVLAWNQRGGPALLKTSAVMPFALLAGAVIFLSFTGLTHVGQGLVFASSSRYVDITGALAVPALALAADAVVRALPGSRAVAIVVVLLLFVGIPGNVRATRRTLPPASFFTTSRHQMTMWPRLDLAARVPGSDRPDPNFAPPVTIDWLRETLRAGRLPGPVHLTPEELATYALMLALNQTTAPVDAPCVPVTASSSIERAVYQGEPFGLRGAVSVRGRIGEGEWSRWLDYGDSSIAGYGPHRLTAVAGPLTLQFRPGTQADANERFVCGGTPNTAS